MDKILIIPDVHGRTFWKKAKELINEVDKVVFLGDYLDPYPHEYILRKDALSNFYDILAFKKEYPDKVILLIGNHDLHYWPRYKTYYGCRRDDERFDQISNLFMDNLDCFQLSYKTENYLFTHAGVQQGWLDTINGKKKIRITTAFKLDKEYNIDNLNDLLYDCHEALWMISRERGGRDLYGSCIWADIYEHISFFEPPIPDIYQVFGHTMTYPTISEEYIEPNFAMLDSQHCYILSDGKFQKIVE
jgi:3',5'-cyclic AMP phosphodiesterase CpdA